MKVMNFMVENFHRKVLDMSRKLERKIAEEINSASRENVSNTPDFILADFMVVCLEAFEEASNRREDWFSVHLDIMNNWAELIYTAIGEASTCWSNLSGAGVFDSTRALEIGKKLLADIKKGTDRSGIECEPDTGEVDGEEK